MEQPKRGIPSFHARHELAFDLVHATEAAALACARLLGKGDPDRVSEVAADAMRRALEDEGPSGTVVLGPRNDAYLSHGISISGGEERVDFGLFPVEGASQVARGSTNAVSIVAAVEPGGFAKLPRSGTSRRSSPGPPPEAASTLTTRSPTTFGGSPSLATLACRTSPSPSSTALGTRT